MFQTFVIKLYSKKNSKAYLNQRGEEERKTIVEFKKLLNSPKTLRIKNHKIFEFPVILGFTRRRV